MVLAELIGVFIIALSILYIYYKFVIFNFWRKRNVFYIEPVVPIGNITALAMKKKQIGEFFQDIYMKYKDHRAIGIYSLHKPNLVIADLDLIRVVLTKEFSSFHDRGIYCNEEVDPLSNHLFAMPGEKWRNMRIKMTPTFTSGKIKQMFSILRETSEELANYLEAKAQMKDSVDIKEIFARYSTDVIMSTAFGIKSNCIEEPNNEYRMQGKKFTETNSIWLALFLFVPKIMDFFSIPFTDQKVASFYMNVFRKNVEYRQTHNIVRHDFMNLLIQLMEKGYVKPDDNNETTDITSAVKKLTISEASAQGFLFLIAGFETSATTATFALYELAQHHNIQDKVRQEIDEMMEKYGGITYDAVSEMTYLHKVINGKDFKEISTCSNIESRLYQRNKFTDNEHSPVERDFNNYTSTWVASRSIVISRSDKFDPERFSADVVAKRHPYAYLPFGEGPRICIGARFGYMQTKVGLVSLLSKYKFNLHSQTQIPLTFDKNAGVLSAKGGIHLTIEPR